MRLPNHDYVPLPHLKPAQIPLPSYKIHTFVVLLHRNSSPGRDILASVASKAIPNIASQRGVHCSSSYIDCKTSDYSRIVMSKGV